MLRRRVYDKSRFDASVAEFQHPVSNQQQSVSERVVDSQNPVLGRVPDFQQIDAKK